MRFKSMTGTCLNGVARPSSVMLCVALMVMVNTSIAAAQVRFQWPTDSLDLAKYTTVEECLAATNRVRDSIQQWQPIRRDTMPPNAIEMWTPLPEPVTRLAQRCSRQFVASTVALNIGWNLLASLYLQGGDETQAGLLFQRRLQLVPPRADTMRASVLDSIVRVYHNAQPAMLVAADSLLEALIPLPAGPTPYIDRFSANHTQMLLARRAGDSVLARQAAQRIDQFARTLTDADRSSVAFMFVVARLIIDAANFLTHTAALDSLQRSTESYVAIRRANIRSVLFGRTLVERDPVGERAALIQGDFWFGTVSGQRPVRPAPGRVSLIVFLSQECSNSIKYPIPPKRRYSFCFPAYAALRRVATRFPEIDITLVGQTYGFFRTLKPLPPVTEADSFQALWLGFHRLPGILAVTTTQFWRLDDPDRRRVNENDPNTEAYAYGRSMKGLAHLIPGTAFLVDPDGVIVHMGSIGSMYAKDRLSEQEFGELMSILVKRTSH